MTATTEFRQTRLSRETRDWLKAGIAMLNEIAKDFYELDPEPLTDLAYALTTVVDEYDAAGGGEAT